MTAPLCPDCGMLRRPTGLRCECPPTVQEKADRVLNDAAHALDLDFLAKQAPDMLSRIVSPEDYAQPRLSEVYGDAKP